VAVHAGGLVLDRVTVSNNDALDRGGAMFVEATGTYEYSTAIITNSTISGNHSGNLVAAVDSKRALAIRNSTIAFNTAETANLGAQAYGALHVDTISIEPTDLQSTIIANNTAGADPSDVSLKGFANFSGADSLVIAANGAALPPDTLAADPLLGPLQDNGGPTLTHLLGTESPAIDAGNNSAGEDFDQRGPGHPRVGGARADIGATESVIDPIFHDGFD
jgi:hypothetical protein